MKQSKTLLDKACEDKRKETKHSFLKEWTEPQFKSMKASIVRHFKNKYFSGRYYDFQPMYRRFPVLDEIMGLAYTSSSEYAGYWICNDEIVTSKHAPYKYIGFAMGEDQKGYAVLWDKDENELIIPL